MARGEEFTDRLFASRARAASGEHEFNQLCTELGIEHRLTPPKSAQTDGMVERFNGCIADVLKTSHFDSALDLEQTLMHLDGHPGPHRPRPCNYTNASDANEGCRKNPARFTRFWR